jgi:hypothetical protein
MKRKQTEAAPRPKPLEQNTGALLAAEMESNTRNHIHWVRWGCVNSSYDWRERSDS